MRRNPGAYPPERQRRPMFCEAEIRQAACEVLHLSPDSCRTDMILEKLKKNRAQKRAK